MRALDSIVMNVVTSATLFFILAQAHISNSPSVFLLPLSYWVCGFRVFTHLVLSISLSSGSKEHLDSVQVTSPADQHQCCPTLLQDNDTESLK